MSGSDTASLAPSRDIERRGWIDVAAVGASASLLLFCLMAWLDNVHINTTNGLWKSFVVDTWKADFHTGRLDPSNYLYFPSMGALCRLLETLGVYPGQSWHQLAVINVVFAGLAVALIYWLVRHLSGRRDIALLAAIAQLGCGFFLSLAVSNEDIMPSYTIVLAAMVLATLWFPAPTARQVAIVAVVFAIGWLTEWRLMFPALPPFLLALAVSPGTLRRRACLVLLFLAAMVGTALVVVILTQGHPGAVGLPGVLWTGKGMGSGWAGFSIDKLSLVPVGMGEYWLGGTNVPAAHLLTTTGAEWASAFAMEMVLLVAIGVLLWRRRHDRRLRVAAIVFLGTLAGGEVMNAYSQPTDPQMQLNVMPWVALAIAALAIPLLRFGSPRRAFAVVVALLILPFAYNVRVFGALRGHDGRMQAAVHQLEELTDPARTVFVYSGFEGMVTWQFALWTHRWEGVCDLGRAPQPTPKFKWIGLFGPLIHHPEMTDEEYLSAIKAQLDCAFDKGYRVVSGPVWTMTTPQLADYMTALNARRRAAALHGLLQNYRARPIGGPAVDGYGAYSEITRGNSTVERR
jgi:hypothetical protein